MVLSRCAMTRVRLFRVQLCRVQFLGGNMRKSAELFVARMAVLLVLAFLASFVLLVR